MSGVREQFATVAEHIAAWKRGGRRWAKVEGFNVDAWQAERDALARADAVATTMAADPVMAVLCGVPAVIGEATPAEDLLAANVALMARLERVGAMALGHDDGVCPTCGAVRQ